MSDDSYSNKDYKAAFEGFEVLGKNYKDAELRALDAKYLYASECMEANNYQEASNLFGTLKNYKDGADKYNEATYACAKQFLEAKNYINARLFFAYVSGYEDSDSLWKQASYYAGIDCIDSKDYKQAISYLQDSDGYKDAKNKIYEAKYAYVKANKNRNDNTTYAYLTDLKSAGYSDAKTIYNELYGWKLEIYAVNNSEKSSSNMSSISRYDNVYFHYKVTGGPPGGELKFSFSGNMPGCSAYKDSNTARNGTDAWYYIYFTSGYKSGTAVGKFYDSNGKLLDSASVSIY